MHIHLSGMEDLNQIINLMDGWKHFDHSSEMININKNMFDKILLAKIYPGYGRIINSIQVMKKKVSRLFNKY